VHPLDLREKISDDIAEESAEFSEIPEFHNWRKALASLDQIPGRDIRKNSNTKRLQDMLAEPQSDTPISLDSCTSDLAENESARSFRPDAEDPRPEVSYKFGSTHNN
ncbi:hypothetical protein RJ639_002721, partial [Escallonia herrerae]